MKYNLLDIISYNQFLLSPKLNDLPLSARYKFSLIIPLLAPHTQFYEKRQQEIAAKYGKKDKEGNFVKTEDGKGIIIEDKFIDDFEKAIKELNELTVEIDADKITCSLNDLEKANLSIAELSQISSFIHN